jgi:hypothetical protein
MLLVFCFLREPSGDAFNALFCITLSVAGIFSSNPSVFLFDFGAPFTPADHLLIAVYIALFRLFCLMQFEIVRRNNKDPPPSVFVIGALFSAVYVTVDAAASIARTPHPRGGERELMPLMAEEKILGFMHAAYAVVAGIGIARAWMALHGLYRKRISVVAVFVAVDIGASLATQIRNPFMNRYRATVLPAVLHRAVPLSLGAFAVFLLHPRVSRRYEQISETRVGGEALDVEVLSEPALGNKFEEDIEENIEIEEDIGKEIAEE